MNVFRFCVLAVPTMLLALAMSKVTCAQSVDDELNKITPQLKKQVDILLENNPRIKGQSFDLELTKKFLKAINSMRTDSAFDLSSPPNIGPEAWKQTEVQGKAGASRGVKLDPVATQWIASFSNRTIDLTDRNTFFFIYIADADFAKFGKDPVAALTMGTHGAVHQQMLNYLTKDDLGQVGVAVIHAPVAEGSKAMQYRFYVTNTQTIQDRFQNVNKMDPSQALKAHAFAPTPGSVSSTLTVAFDTPTDARLGSYQFDGSGWSAVASAPKATISRISGQQRTDLPRKTPTGSNAQALGVIGGVASDGTNAYLLTCAEEPHRNRLSSSDYRDNMIKILKVDASGTTSLFRDLNKADFIPADWKISTPLTRGTARMRYDGGFLGLAVAHWWGSPDCHQRATRMAIKLADSKSEFYDTKGHGPNWHCFDSCVLLAGNTMFTADTTEAGVTLKRYAINAGSPKGMQAHRIIHSAAPQDDGKQIRLAGLVGGQNAKDDVAVGFIHRGTLYVRNVPHGFPTYPSGDKGWEQVLTTSSRTFGSSGNVTHARLAAISNSDSLLIWQEGEGSSSTTYAKRIANTSGTGTSQVSSSTTRVENSSDAFLIEGTDGNQYVAWITHDETAKKVYANTISVSATTNGTPTRSELASY